MQHVVDRAFPRSSYPTRKPAFVIRSNASSTSSTSIERSEFGKPIWLTEFACDGSHSAAEHKTYMEAAIPYLGSNPFDVGGTMPSVSPTSGSKKDRAIGSSKQECPCHSGLRYASCCGPLHDGSRSASTPEALMRSRYAAFARGLGHYLVRTLTARHPDRAQDEASLVLALSRAKDTQRFLGLTILDAHHDGEHGEVTFHARIFEKGADRSFTERSSFEKEEGDWRYAGGVSLDSRP